VAYGWRSLAAQREGDKQPDRWTELRRGGEPAQRRRRADADLRCGEPNRHGGRRQLCLRWRREAPEKSNGKLYWYGIGSDPLAETSLAGAAVQDFIFFGGKRTARLDVASGTVHYYFSDHLGSASVVTNAAGTTIEEESDYYPWGRERVIVDLLPDQNYKFTGKERDTESGLDFFGARYYSSTVGRFLSPDEFTGGPVDAFSSNDPAPPATLPYADITNPQSLNKYSYAYNEPQGNVDPDGHSVWSKVAKVLLKGGEVAGALGSAKENINIALDSKAPVLDRIEAAGKAASEFLPFSASDGEDLGKLGGQALSKLDEAGGVGAFVQKTYQTYTKTNPETGEVYSGRTSGTGTPKENLAARDGGHHRNKDGFGAAKLDKSSTNSDAIKGREQMLHEEFAKQGRSGNLRNPVGPRNPNRSKYIEAAKTLFGRLVGK
jgi:RHS repeat-associated protein